ncbi:NADH-quinone oxidoreductase subunit N [bacterium]|nr:NADH-quinone oxidoreductase subunit N [bacterium]
MNASLLDSLHAILLSPEFYILITAIAVLIWESVGGKERPWVSSYLTLFGLFVTILMSFGFKEPEGITFFGAYTHDGLSQFINMIILMASIFTVFAASHFIGRWSKSPGTFYVVLLFATFGMMLMASASELITLFVAVETTTIALYILTAYFKDDRLSAEASMKFILIGTVFATIMLFGMVLVYGATGTTVLSEITSAATASVFEGSEILLLSGVIMILVGLSFKITAVPFHMWAPDAYTGAPTPVTAFLSVASKASGFAVIIRLYYGIFNHIAGLEPFLANTFIILAGMTMILGNFLALPQKNIKRLLAYSSIAQAGYMIIGLAAYSDIGISAILFYLTQYMFANFGIFIVVTVVYNSVRSDDMSAYMGLSRRSPFLALVLLICILSLAGIPPLAGFIGKVYLFAAGIDKGYYILVTIGILMSVVSVYYYLIVLKKAYIEKNADTTPIPIPFGAKASLWVAMLGVILTGLFPNFVVNSAQVLGNFILASVR